jgi:lipopolysaccharide heptosyltransferase I
MMSRILVIRLSSIGDIVHALPAVAALGESFPESEIVWAVEKRYAGILEVNRPVRRVLELDTLGWRTRWTSPRTAEEVVRNLVRLRGLDPDVTVDFQGLLKSAALARISGSPRRVGFEERWLREPAAAAFYTERVSAQGRRHVVEENFALVERLGARTVPRCRWQFPLPRSVEAEQRVNERLAALGARKFLVINPGGGWTSKRWPPERYAELVRKLEEQDGHQVLITGSPAEEPMIGGILERAQVRRAAFFRSTLVEFMALVRRASLWVGGDTGPLHLAAAIGTPIVAIYGPTNPARNGPFASSDITLRNGGEKDREDQRTHWKAGAARRSVYLEGVPVDAVRAAIRQRLAAADGD